jgi:formamidopyrimidine-DNA glycosylase
VPELPEVETIVRDLRPHLIGRSFIALRVSKKALRRRWAPAWKAHILHRRVRAIERRGKWILIDLDGPWLLVHLGMSGQFTVALASAARQNHTHLAFTLDDGRHELRFRDIRRFGSVTFYPDRQALDAHFARNRLGPEPFDLDAAGWSACLQTTRRNLKAVLLDQTVLAGVGNIYADEALFEARLYPDQPAALLTARQAETLRQAIVKVLTRAIEMRGSSIQNYVGGCGLKGRFQEEHGAYGRTGEPCARCATAILRIVLAGRATHYCPRCQAPRAAAPPRRRVASPGRPRPGEASFP